MSSPTKTLENGQDKNATSNNKDDDHNSGTRVFKKSSPNGKITTYIGKRDFIDHLDHVDPIDGVVLVDADYMKDRKVFGQVLAAFRYGREDLDVLGLSFRKDLYLAQAQIYPPETDENGQEKKRQLTQLQQRLLKKLGENAYPFYFELPRNCPSSITLQPAPGDDGKPCGVDYELLTFVGENIQDKPHKRSSVRLGIRKLTYAPDESRDQPHAEARKEFMMGTGVLKLEVSLDKEKYYHGEDISVNVLVDNNSSKSVKKVRLTVKQYANICLFSSAEYKCTVTDTENEEGCPINPNQTGWCKVYSVCPLLLNNRDKRGLALDGQLKHEDTNLASSTVVMNADKERLGIIVSYKLRVKLCMGFGASDLAVELPFTLTHPKPILTPTTTVAKPMLVFSLARRLFEHCSVEEPTKPVESDSAAVQPPAALDHNLIQLDTEAVSAPKPAGTSTRNDDDLIFEDFARLRLQGVDNLDTEA